MGAHGARWRIRQLSPRLLKRISCFHSDVDFGVTAHLVDMAGLHDEARNLDAPVVRGHWLLEGEACRRAAVGIDLDWCDTFGDHPTARDDVNVEIS